MLLERLLLLCLLLVHYGYVNALSSCQQVATGAFSSCYSLRTSCHFDLQTNKCLDGASNECYLYLSDTTGCNANTSCTRSSTSGMCTIKPAACTLITSSTPCNQRSDCRWTSSCISSSTTTCGSITASTGMVACESAGCFWDSYVLKCYNSMAEVVSTNPCSTWTNYPLPNTACAFHGCSLDSTQTICQTPGVGGNNATAASTSLTALFLNPYVTTNTLTFNVDVWLPISLNNWPADWNYISIGGGVSGYGAPAYMKPSVCNNIQSYNDSSPPPVYVPVTDAVGLRAYYLNWITTNGTYSFPYTTAFGSQLKQIIGDINVKNGTLNTQVQLEGTGLWVVHKLSSDLNDLVNNCNSFGASVVYSGANQIYTIPISVIQRDYENSFIQISTNFYVNIALNGKVNSVSSSSRFQPVLYQQEISSITSTCPAGMARLHIVYLLQMQNVYASGVFVGPRNTTDVNFTSAQLGYTLQNCYKEAVVSISKPYTSNTVSYTQIVTETNCRTLTSDGDAFNYCSYADPADRISDMGATAPYPTSLDAVHDLWVTSYICPNAASFANNYVNCTKSVLNADGSADRLMSKVTLKLFPDTSINVALDVYAGLLPTPFTLDLSQIQTLSQVPNTVLTTTDLYNSNLQWNGQFTFVIGIFNPLLRNKVNLTLDVDTLFRLDPLDSTGTVMAGRTPLYISNVFKYMTYVPKSMISKCNNTLLCRNTPATQNQSGYDSFSIPVITLRTLLPANGYAVTVAYYYSLPKPTTGFTQMAVPINSLQAATKRFNTMATHHHNIHVEAAGSGSMQLKDSDTAAPATGTRFGSYAFRFIIDDSNNPSPPLITVNRTNYAASNSSEIIPAFQVSFRVFVQSGSLITNPDNTTALQEYVFSHIVGALAVTVNINTNQIINVRVSSSPTSDTVLMARAVTRQLLQSTTNVIGTPVYVSFVIIPAQNSSITAETIVIQLLSSVTMPALMLNLGDANLRLDMTIPPTTVRVFVSSENLYIGNTFNIDTTTPSPSEPGRSMDNVYATMGTVLGVFVCSAVVVIWYGSRAVKNRERRLRKKYAASAGGPASDTLLDSKKN